MDTVSTTCPSESDNTSQPGAARARVVVFLLLLVLAGGGLRMVRLGALGLQGDEGYQYQAVEAVLAHGVPRLETGYVYLRSPHFIYAQAGVASVLGLDEVSLRLPAVFFGLLCIPLGYLLGRDLVDVRVGVLLAVMLAFSAWEIELSRYARFYTLLQAVYIAGVWCFFRGYVGGSRGYKLGYWALVLLAITTHQLGALLGVCLLLLLPLDGYTVKQRLGFAAQFGGVGVLFIAWGMFEKKLAAAWQGADYVAMPIGEVIAMTQPAGGQADFHVGLLPEFATPRFDLAGFLWHHHPTAMASIMALACGGIIAAIVLLVRRRAWGVGGLASAALALAAVQMGAMAGAVLLLLLALGVSRRRDLARPLIVLGVVGSGLLLTAAIVVASVLGGQGVVSSTLEAMHYPDVSRFLLEWMYRGWKAVGALALVGLVLAGLRCRSDDGRCTGRWLAIGALLVPVLAASWVGGKHNESRYFFFLYPLILLLAALALREVADTVGGRFKRRVMVPGVLGILLAGLMALSSDFRPGAVWAVSSRTYIDARDTDRSPLSMPYYAGFHQDQKTPGRYVRERRGAAERVMVVGPPHRSVNYAIYAGGIDYIVGQPIFYTRMTRDAEGRLHDPDTGAELVWEPQRLREILASAGDGLWVLADQGLRLDWPIQIPEDMRAELFSHIDPPRAMVGGDGITFTAHLKPASATDPSTVPTQPTP